MDASKYLNDPPRYHETQKVDKYNNKQLDNVN